MTNLAPDILCIQELNIAWHNLEADQKLHERTEGWFPATRTVCAWNQHHKGSETHVYGGTAIIIKGNSVGRIGKTGKDQSGLGRWCWTQLRGFGGRSLTVVSAYRPVNNPSYASSVWSQQKTYFDEQSPPRLVNPCSAFLSDLVQEISPIHATGSQIVLCMDANEKTMHLNNNIIEQAFAQLGLTDIILTNHNRHHAPATTLTGSRPVDTIMTGTTLSSCPSGYLPIPHFTDHRPL